MKKKLKTQRLRFAAPASLTFLLSLGFAPGALAQAADEAAPASAPPQAEAPSSPAAGAQSAAAKADQTPPAPTGFWDRSNLFGDMGGLRTWLGNYGVTFNLQETSEYLNNLSGGVSSAEKRQQAAACASVDQAVQQVIDRAPANANAEVIGSDVLQRMRLVEDGDLIVR